MGCNILFNSLHSLVYNKTSTEVALFLKVYPCKALKKSQLSFFVLNKLNLIQDLLSKAITYEVFIKDCLKDSSYFLFIIVSFLVIGFDDSCL
jgi:hypothetical protein